MPNFIDLTNQRFGKLTVIMRADNDKYGRARWICLCDCGKQLIVDAGHLKSEQTKSCGCLRIEGASKQNLKHGHNRKGQQSRTYKTWQHMMSRCNNPNDPKYKYYGKRKITVCDKWDISKGGSFLNFLEDMGECPPGLTLDRINNNLGYFKENCRWATQKEQQNNRSNNKLYTYKGKTQCLSAWAEEYKISHRTLWNRLHVLGWNIEKSLNTPIRKIKKAKNGVGISGIYKIICCNNKFYIGGSINISRRLKNHISLLQHNKHVNEYLQKDWNKYGKQNFRFEIIETIHDIKQLLIREQWWLDHTKCYKRKIGFNISRNNKRINKGENK